MGKNKMGTVLHGKVPINSVPSVMEQARMIAALVDELIPGDKVWPSASLAGVHGILALRLLSQWEDKAIMQLAELLDWRGGGLFSSNPAQREQVVSTFQACDPDLFDQIYTAAVLAYYETPFVVSMIQQSGRPYAARPHLVGYPMTPFDTDLDAPNHRRGHYLATDDVRPVDVSKLELDKKKTEKWGVFR